MLKFFHYLLIYLLHKLISKFTSTFVTGTVISEKLHLKEEIVFLKTWQRGSTNNSPFMGWRRAIRCSPLKVKWIWNIRGVCEWRHRCPHWVWAKWCVWTPTYTVNGDLKPWPLLCERKKINAAVKKKSSCFGNYYRGNIQTLAMLGVS